MEPLYETSASFGEIIAESKPVITHVSVPEAKKRRQPTKHYVYKIVVNWSNGQSTVIYRRYSMFFDFMVKLQELYSSLKETNSSFASDSQFPLPELPGKVLFGRSEVHQVAEKRRVKVEEFCQALVSLPHEISQSSIVTAFFNTWPDDTLHHSRVLNKETSSSSSAMHTNGLSSPTEQVISHPDEMENLEQYRVIADYNRADNHQVDLTAGQLVHVIEKHDTGWWMIVTDEEQGYAPAAYLESIDKTYDSLEPEVSSNEEYEAMDSYIPQSEDEVGISVGEKVTIVHKSMDGWWKISKKGRTGYCPATIIRRVSQQTNESSPSAESITYESEKSIYEGLNIHKKPPPRRNTIKRSDDIYIVPRPLLAGKVAGTNTDMSDTPAYYKVPRPSHSSTSGSDEDRHGVCSNRPFSPNHYEMGPVDSDIYENTDFDHPFDPSEGIVHHTIYQNTSFDGTPLLDEPKKLPPLKKFGSPQLKKSPNRPPPPPNKPTASKKPDSPVNSDLDNEYINPEEFAIKDETSAHSPPKKTPFKSQDSTGSAGRVKYVSIMPMPEPPKGEEGESKSDSMKSRNKLAFTKSLGFLDSARSSTSPENDDEYVEMDPVYAAVAPDEPPSEGNDTTTAGRQTPVQQKKKRPPLPVPYNKQQQQQQQPSEQLAEVPRGNILKRTKSLEDLLAKSESSPLAPKKPLIPLAGKGSPSNGYDHIKPLPNPKPSLGSSSPAPKKPEPGKKKPYSKFKLGGGGSDSKPEPVISAPVLVNSTNDIQTPPPPSCPPPSASKNSRSYTAIEDYTSQADGCLSFSAGERCLLIKQSSGGWWYVNINGKEGWTPGEFWEEEKRAMTVALTQPPQLPPQKLPTSKPRSGTTAAILSDTPPPPLTHQLSLDISRSNSNSDGSPKSSKGRGLPPPPKPRPLNSSPPNSRKLEHHGSAAEMKFGSPPPPPPPRRAASQANGLGDYGHLSDVTTTTPIEEFSWYVGGMEREKAEQFLIENGKQREFLVRERVNKKGYYALSIRHHYSVKHFNIDPKPDGSYSMGVMQFSSIEEIVKHYQHNSLFVHEGQSVNLGQPVRRKSSKFAQH